MSTSLLKSSGVPNRLLIAKKFVTYTQTQSMSRYNINLNHTLRGVTKSQGCLQLFFVKSESYMSLTILFHETRHMTLGGHLIANTWIVSMLLYAHKLHNVVSCFFHMGENLQNTHTRWWVENSWGTFRTCKDHESQILLNCGNNWPKWVFVSLVF